MLALLLLSVAPGRDVLILSAGSLTLRTNTGKTGTPWQKHTQSSPQKLQEVC